MRSSISSERIALVKLVVASAIALAAKCDREITLEFEGSLAQLFDELSKRYGPTFRQRLLESDGTLRRFVNLYVNGEDARYLGGLETLVGHGATIDLLPAIAGG